MYTLTIVCVGIATYLTRFPSLLVGRTLRVTPRLKQALNYIPIGVFAAMVAPAIALHPGSGGTMDWPFLSAALFSVVTAFLTRSPLWTMIVGVLAVALLRLL